MKVGDGAHDGKAEAQVDAAGPVARPAQASFIQDGVFFQSTLRLIVFNTRVLTVDSNNDTFVDNRDDETIKTDSSAKFVCWEGDTRLEPQDATVDCLKLSFRGT